MWLLETVQRYAGYTPSKAALHGFAEVLHEELASRVVLVDDRDAVSTDTPTLVHERETAPEPAKRLIEATRVISADKVAEKVLKATARGRFSVISGLDVRLQTAAYQAFSRIGHALVDRIARG